MPSKRALSLTLIAGISLLALTCILPDKTAQAAQNLRAGRASEQIADGSHHANIEDARRTVRVHLTGDPDQTTQSGDQEPRPANPQPPPQVGGSGSRSFLDFVLDTLVQGFNAVRGTLRY